MEFWRETEFWIAVAFVIGVALIWWQGGGIVIAGLDARAQRIREQLDEAQRLRSEAETMLGEYQRKQRDAAGEAQEILAQATADAERAAKQAEADLETAIRRREEQARDKIAQAEVKALAEIRAVAVDIAIRAVRILLSRALDQHRGASLIDQAIEDLPKRLH
jgi:F-type H+-transporting ATPase subunit b